MTDSVRQPDLYAYYDIYSSKVEYSRTEQTESKVQNIVLYTSPKLTQSIGSIVFDIKAFISNPPIASRVLNIIVAFPFGTLSGQRTNQLKIVDVKPPLGPDSFVIYTILSGNNDFIGSKGYITITSNETSIRRLDIWLDKQ